MPVQVHVQVQLFPKVCLKTLLGERAGTTMEPFCINFAAILDALWTIWGSLGTTLGPLGTIFETLFPRFGQSFDFRRFPGNCLTPPHPLFHARATLFPGEGASQAENRCFLRELGLRSHFVMISGQILGGLGQEK